ncbi:unnamed protein product [Ilex paraguariensis]|uniref:Uncharacterized protein n=1 Tax=Ilex paraguariensis TaxID=185542 RepID=A0ABC8SC64_9AQUA
MQTSSLHSPPLPPPPFSINHPHRKLGFVPRKRPFNSITALKRDANGKDHHHSGKLVDESMIILRQRIHEMKMVEKNSEPPDHWMEWERRYFRRYDSDVVEAVGFLQSSLMEIRPGLALGMVILVFFSVLSSMAVVGFCFMDIVKWIFDGIQLSS